MTHRTITAEEARTLREAATPGPWGVRHKPHGWDFCLVAAAPDLAATVEALHAEVERLRAAYERLEAAAGRASETLCPECGPAVQVDEDGCCIGCGNGAMGTYVAERAEALVAALEAAP